MIHYKISSQKAEMCLFRDRSYRPSKKINNWYDQLYRLYNKNNEWTTPRVGKSRSEKSWKKMWDTHRDQSVNISTSSAPARIDAVPSYFAYTCWLSSYWLELDFSTVTSARSAPFWPREPSAPGSSLVSRPTCRLRASRYLRLWSRRVLSFNLRLPTASKSTKI